ncbi:hypothetical protein IP84_09775 [beta proteobacterium AAP99]|nr:hypothetical protein IP84_09775 [beta proteobacterium AAP99]
MRVMAGLGLALLCAAGHALERIEWALPELPPVYFYRADGRAPTSPAELGAGGGDGYLRAIMRQMPNVRHEIVPMNFARAWAEIERGRTLCVPTVVRLADRGHLAWYTPMSPPPPLTVVARADRAAEVLGNQPVVSLAALLARPDLSGLVPANRSFGRDINALLAQPAAQSQIERLRDGASAQAANLLLLGRADYWLEWPHVAEWQVRNLPRRVPMTWRTVLEFPVDQSLYIACTRSPAGREAIEAIDAAIRRASRDKAYRTAAVDWYPPEIREAVTPRFKRFFDERSKQPLIE